jgi:nucleotide-binding universal stress UspA family protein
MYAKIMVPFDGSEMAECVLPHVETISNSVQVKNVVRVVNPIRLPASAPATDDFGFREKDHLQLEDYRSLSAESYLKKLANRLEIEEGANISSAVVEGKVADSLADYAVIRMSI